MMQPPEVDAQELSSSSGEQPPWKEPRREHQVPPQTTARQEERGTSEDSEDERPIITRLRRAAIPAPERAARSNSRRIGFGDNCGYVPVIEEQVALVYLPEKTLLDRLVETSRPEQNRVTLEMNRATVEVLEDPGLPTTAPDPPSARIHRTGVGGGLIPEFQLLCAAVASWAGDLHREVCEDHRTRAALTERANGRQAELDGLRQQYALTNLQLHPTSTELVEAMNRRVQFAQAEADHQNKAIKRLNTEVAVLRDERAASEASRNEERENANRMAAELRERTELLQKSNADVKALVDLRDEELQSWQEALQ
ncbi:hypothetical protein R1flu_009083 [Riccia fluitans]|uniref:Uncharacterized protein n=1 Tax=Riccia fluitans TaxID=41844 RepID=A0ABD1Z128_9MARC